MKKQRKSLLLRLRWLNGDRRELAERTQCASPHFSFSTFFAYLPDFVTRFHSKKVGFLTRFRLTIDIFDPYLDPFDLPRRLVCHLTDLTVF